VLIVVPVVHEVFVKTAPLMIFSGALSVFPVTLKWLYAASFSYAVAIAIYQVFCPPEVRRFAHIDEYVQAQYEIFARAHPHHRESIILSNLNDYIDRDAKKRIEDLHSKIERGDASQVDALQKELDDYILTLHGDAVQRFLLRDYRAKNSRAGIARWLSYSFYIAGTAILAVLFVIRSYYVLIH